jgi:hypothetical protein
MLARGVDEWSTSRPGHFTPGETAPVPIVKVLGPIAGLHAVQKRKDPVLLLGIESQFLHRPFRIPTLYQLSYLAFFSCLVSLSCLISCFSFLLAGTLASLSFFFSCFSFVLLSLSV